MTERPNAIPVTIVSTDPPLLREAAWVLAAFGYDVRTSADWSDDAAWRQSTRSQILLIDARDRTPAMSLLGAARRGPYVHRVALAPTDDASLAGELLRGGADDVLPCPVNPCQLLARLRAGARRLEFERRLAEASSFDEATGLATRQGFLRQYADNDSRDQTLVMVGVDSWATLQEESGRRACRNLSAALARSCGSMLRPTDLLFGMGDGRFGLLMAPGTEAEGRQLAEAIATKFSGRDSRSTDARSRPTVSAAVGEWPEGATADEFLERVTNALAHLVSYGGGRVMGAEDVEREVDAWRRQMESGELFGNVVAQDVMEAFPLTVQKSEGPAALTRAGLIAEGDGVRPLPPFVPVVDDAGKLIGCVRPFGASASSVRIEDPPVQAPHDLPLSDLFAKFEEATEGCLVVVEAGRPVGYLTNEGLATLMIDGLDADTYREVAEECPASSSLIVAVEPPPVAMATDGV